MRVCAWPPSLAGEDVPGQPRTPHEVGIQVPGLADGIAMLKEREGFFT